MNFFIFLNNNTVICLASCKNITFCASKLKARLLKRNQLREKKNILINRGFLFQVLGLRESIANLILSLIEENGPGKTDISLVREENKRITNY